MEEDCGWAQRVELKDVTPNQTIWDIDRFVSEKITEGELERLQTSLVQIREELEEERQENRRQTPCGERRRKGGTGRIKRTETGKKSLSKRAGGSEI